MSTFNKCIANGSYDVVSPGEMCSLMTARMIGIYDTTNYYTPDYKDLKTFKLEKDASEGRQKEVCSLSKNGSNAYRMCALDFGIGFVRKPAYPNKCITVGCPPGFESDRGECKKPLEDYAVSKRARCDERWYDWFLIPNYHLGNNYYSSKPGECYQPCPSYSVPQYAKDPVDESTAGFNKTEKLDKCLPRTEYMNGKYMEGSDYCPVSWVYRLAATPSVLTEQINTKLDELQQEKKAENMNSAYQQLRSNAEAEARQVAQTAGSLIQNVEPPNEALSNACQPLTTDERVQFAYDVCERLMEDDMWYGQKLEEELGDSEQVQQAKTKMLKQACNAMFCSGNNHEQIGRSELCIPGVTQVEPIDEDKNIPNAPSSQSGKRFIFASASFALKAIIYTVFGVLITMFIIFFLYPKVIVPVARFIYELFSRFKKNKTQLAAEELTDKLPSK